MKRRYDGLGRLVAYCLVETTSRSCEFVRDELRVLALKCLKHAHVQSLKEFDVHLHNVEPDGTQRNEGVPAGDGVLWLSTVEIKRTEPSMIHHKDQDPYVIRNTAKGGDVVAVPLSDVGVLAWRMWLEQNPWNGAREQRVMQTYALLRVRADTLGPEIRPVNIDCTSPERRDPALNKNPCGFRSPSRTAASGTAVTIPMLASLLDARLGTLVTDETALRGQFDLTLTWSPDGAAAVDGVSLFTAVQEQLGLKLEARRIPVDVVAIKRVERPTEN